MDPAAARALELVVERVVAGYLDQFLAEAALHSGPVGELRGEVTRLRKEVTALERTLPPRMRRQAQVIALREQGASTSLIAQKLNLPRATVNKDLVELQLPTPERLVGVDGVARRAALRRPG
jgi:DNA-binding NarL/FixJ family response regulator